MTGYAQWQCRHKVSHSPVLVNTSFSLSAIKFDFWSFDTVHSSIKWQRSLFHICVHQQSNLQQHYHSLFRKKIIFKMLFTCALFFLTFHLNCGLYAVSAREPSEQMSNFWTVLIFINWFLVFCTPLTLSVLQPVSQSITLFTHSFTRKQSTDGGETTTVGGETSRGRNVKGAKRP